MTEQAEATVDTVTPEETTAAECKEIVHDLLTLAVQDVTSESGNVAPARVQIASLSDEGLRTLLGKIVAYLDDAKRELDPQSTIFPLQVLHVQSLLIYQLLIELECWKRFSQRQQNAIDMLGLVLPTLNTEN